MKLITHNPQRVFAFGCSFTAYAWCTWADIVGKELGVPLYNFGKAGAGNQLIVNTLAQAHRHYNITKDDLVMICWTGVMREDRWIKGHWITHGDISRGIHAPYDKDFVEKLLDPVGCYVRDLPKMALAKDFLEQLGCQYHMMSMSDIWSAEQDYLVVDYEHPAIEKIKTLFADFFDPPLPSYEIDLWGGRMTQIKTHYQENVLQSNFSDWHPTPAEHLDFLEKVFTDYAFSDQTRCAVDQVNKKLVDAIKVHETKYADRISFTLSDLSTEDFGNIMKSLHLVNNMVEIQFFEW